MNTENITQQQIDNYFSETFGETGIRGKVLKAGNTKMRLFPTDEEFVKEMIKNSIYLEAETGKGYIKKITENTITLSEEGNHWFKKTYMNSKKISTPKINKMLDSLAQDIKPSYERNDNHQRIVENNVWKSTGAMEHDNKYKGLILARDDNLEVNPVTKEPLPLDKLTQKYHSKYLLD